VLFKRLNRTDPEQVFIVVLANEGATLNKDQTVQWEVASASVDGVRVRDMDTSNEYCFAGVVDAAISDAAYGLIQIYGYRSTSILFQTNTSQDTGLPLVPVAAQDYFQSVASTTASNATATLQPVFAALLETIASSSASATISKKVFVRAM
jgi:hypothetical protein